MLYQPFPYAALHLDVGLRVVQGVFVDLGVHVGTPGPSEYGRIGLPVFSAGASYRLPLGAVDLRLGGGLRVALDNASGAVEGRLGGAGLVGVEGSPTEPLLLGAQVQLGGLAGELFIYAGVTAGIAL